MISPTQSSTASQNAKKTKKGKGNNKLPDLKPESPAPSIVSEDEDDVQEHLKDQKEADTDGNQPSVDFSLYLQQTGSIIALAKLMDALDNDNGQDVSDEIESDVASI